MAPLLSAFFTLCLLAWTVIAYWKHRRLVIDSVRSFLLSSDHPINLAIARIVVVGLALNASSVEHLVTLASLPMELRSAPPGCGWFLNIFPINPVSTRLIGNAFQITAWLALLGIGTRFFLPLSTLLAFYTLGLPKFFGKIDHDHFIFWLMVVLAASPSGHALSMDALYKRLLRGGSQLQRSVRYGFPLRIMWLLIGVFYFSAGLWKWLNCGVDWFLSDNMRDIMVSVWLEHGDWTPGFRIDYYPFLYRTSALMVLLFELLFPIGIFWHKTRYPTLVAGLLFHASTLYFMRIYFAELQACYLLFIDWTLLQRFCCFQDLGQDSRKPSASCFTVCSALVFGVLLSVLGDYHGWPFAAAPSFGYFAGNSHEGLTLTLQCPNGKTRRFEPHQFCYFGNSANCNATHSRLITNNNLEQFTAYTNGFIERGHFIQAGETCKVEVQKELRRYEHPYPAFTVIRQKPILSYQYSGS